MTDADDYEVYEWRDSDASSAQRRTPADVTDTERNAPQEMTTDAAIDVARRIRSIYTDPTVGERAAVVLAGDVIATREAITDAVSTWAQYRDNPHIPPDLRRAFDALAERRR